MPTERPDWGEGGEAMAARGGAAVVLVEETGSAIVSDGEKQAMLAEVEAAGNGVSVESEHLETFGPIAATLYAELPEAEVDAICDEFDALPAETQKWVTEILAATPHANLKRLAKTLKNKATLEHAAAMRTVGW